MYCFQVSPYAIILGSPTVSYIYMFVYIDSAVMERCTCNPQVMLRVQLGTIGTSLAQTGSPISQTGNQSMLDWFAHLTDRKPVHARLVPVFPFMESSCHFIIIILPRLSAYPFMESSCRFNPQAALRVHINKAMEPPIRLARTSYHN